MFATLRFALCSFGSEKWYIGFCVLYCFLFAFLSACLALEWLGDMKAKRAAEIEAKSTDGIDGDSAAHSKLIVAVAGQQGQRSPRWNMWAIAGLLAVLTIAFLVLLTFVIVYYEGGYNGLHADDVQLLGTAFKQWHFGVGALIFAPIVLSLSFTLAVRRSALSREECGGHGHEEHGNAKGLELKLPVLSRATLVRMYALTAALYTGGGLALYFVADSVMLLAALIFWPPFTISWLSLFSDLKHRDYRIFDEASEML